MAFWRIPARAIPSTAGDRLRWLDTEWLRMDAWVDERGAAQPASSDAAAGLAT